MLRLLLAEATRGGVAYALSKVEAHGLDGGHGDERDADGTRCLNAQASHEEGVREVVDAGDQVGEDGRCRKGEDEPPHGRLRHLPELLLLGALF